MSGSSPRPSSRELDVPVLLDGAQGVGAVAVDVRALGCDAYAGAGQKWLCGPDGTGMLYVQPRAARAAGGVRAAATANLADPNAGLDAGAARGRAALRRAVAERRGARLRAGGRSSVLEEAGWAAVHERARALAARLAELLAERGREPAPRGETHARVLPERRTPTAERARLAEAGVIVRNIPGRPWLRASVGAWNDENDLERLLGALAT